MIKKNHGLCHVEVFPSKPSFHNILHDITVKFFEVKEQLCIAGFTSDPVY